MSKGGLRFHISCSIVKKNIAILVNSVPMISLFTLFYWQNSIDRIKVGFFMTALKKIVFTLKLLGNKDTWVSENIEVCMRVRMCV